MDAEFKDKYLRNAPMGDLTMDEKIWLLTQINDILGLDNQHSYKGRLL